MVVMLQFPSDIAAKIWRSHLQTTTTTTTFIYTFFYYERYILN